MLAAALPGWSSQILVLVCIPGVVYIILGLNCLFAHSCLLVALWFQPATETSSTSGGLLSQYAGPLLAASTSGGLVPPPPRMTPGTVSVQESNPSSSDAPSTKHGEV